MSDNYEFSKSTMPQSIDNESPYAKKDWGYVNDINGGIYSNAGLTLVQFDLSSIYNSTALIDPAQMFIVVPLTYVSAYSSSLTANSDTANLLNPITGGWASLGLKNGYHHLLHGADLIINGKTIEQYQPGLNHYLNSRLLSQMSYDDLETLGPRLGFGELLDNHQSLSYYGSGNITGTTALGTSAFPTAPSAAAAASTLNFTGNGVVNNFPYPPTYQAGNSGDMSRPGTTQGSNTYNNGLYTRLKKIVDISGAGTATNLYGADNTKNIVSATQLANEFKPTYQVLNTKYAVWYDYAVLRMCDIFDSMKNLCLMKKMDASLRLYFNTGSYGLTSFLGAPIANLTGTNAMMFVVSQSLSTFTNTCPLIQSGNISATAANSLYPTTTLAIVSGLFIGRATNTSLFGGINLANSNASNVMNACRMYYPQITLKPEKLIPYISGNRSKKITYSTILTNQFNNLSTQTSFSALVQSGVQGIRGILVIPMLSASTNGSSGTAVYSSGVGTFAQALSPFDTCPATTGPLSLINLQVSIGGQNVLMNTLNFTYENFFEQIVLYKN